jgi:VIT1/CCC1 family predicted Fe2+/Mn2+ transporter
VTLEDLSPLEDPTPIEAPDGLDEHRGGLGVDHFIGDLVFGANDGLITTFAIVSSVAGADLGSKAALVLGLANLLGDGVSMAAGNYLGRRSDTQVAASRLGRRATRRGPMTHGGAMFAAFVVAGSVPLLPYLVLDATAAFLMALLATAVTLFGVGSARTLVTRQPWLGSGVEMLTVGSVAAILAYGVGWLFRSVV